MLNFDGAMQPHPDEVYKASNAHTSTLSDGGDNKLSLLHMLRMRRVYPKANADLGFAQFAYD